MNFIRDFKLKLLRAVCEDVSETSVKVFRKPYKNGKQKGEFCFPSLNNSKVWQGLKAKNINIEELPTLVDEVQSCEEQSGMVYIHLNRNSIVDDFFSTFSLDRRNKTDKTVENCDNTKPNTSEITSERSRVFCDALNNLISEKHVCVSSTNLQAQIQVIFYIKLKIFKYFQIF